MTEKVPKALNWVKARAECSPERRFMLLDTVVDSDVRVANARGGGSVVFRLNRPTVDSLVVVRERNAFGFKESEVVAFNRMSDGSVAVTRRTTKGSWPMFEAEPHVSLNGECLFSVNGQPMEPWQVSKLALERLFFDFGLSATEEK